MEERYQKIIDNNKSDPNSGFLLIDKSKDWTSFDVVAKLRGITKIKKIGHAGTLDPFATGLLIVAVGKATRLLELLLGQNKSYLATMILGQTSDTFDVTGKITVNESFNREITRTELEKVIKEFVGKQQQLPPMFSAKKINGKKLYELARKGIEVERETKAIEIYSIELTDCNFPKVEFLVKCSTGTYIRTLAHDIGQKLGCGALLEELRRTQIAKVDLTEAKTIEEIDRAGEQNWNKYLYSMDEIVKWLD